MNGATAAITELSEIDRHAIGPRRPGGIYRSDYWGLTYRVAAVLTGDQARAALFVCNDFAIVEIDLDGPARGHRRVHCTRWDQRDLVISFPLGEDPYLDDIERLAQLRERAGLPDDAHRWRQGAASFLTGRTDHHGWATARRHLADAVQTELAEQGL